MLQAENPHAPSLLHCLFNTLCALVPVTHVHGHPIPLLSPADNGTELKGGAARVFLQHTSGNLPHGRKSGSSMTSPSLQVDGMTHSPPRRISQGAMRGRSAQQMRPVGQPPPFVRRPRGCTQKTAGEQRPTAGPKTEMVPITFLV